MNKYFFLKMTIVYCVFFMTVIVSMAFFLFILCYAYLQS